MFNIKLLCFIPLLLVPLHSTPIDIQDDLNSSTLKDDAVKFSIELGAKTDFWSPGLSKNIIDYKTEGLFLGYGKVKLKLYDSDVIGIEKYTTLSSSNTQNDLLEYYKDSREKESSIDGLRISVQIIKVLNYLFEQEWLGGFNYEYNNRNFIGNATLQSNSVYWYGNIEGGRINQDFALLEKEDRLSFKTEFTSHKLFYQWDNVYKQVQGAYASLGVFDEAWSKPTFIGDTSLNGKFPIVFDANYYSRGLATTIGIKNSNYNLKAYVDVGVDNEMKIIQKKNKYSNLNKDVKMYMMGLDADYRFTDIYSHKRFTTDIILGMQIQYNKINQAGSIELDAERLYALHAGVEIIF